MPAPYEDSMQGATDLGSAGDPQPARPMTKNEQNAAVKREVGRAGPSKPQPGGKESGHPPDDDQGGQAAPDPSTDQSTHPMAGVLAQIQQQQKQGNPITGLDWFAKTGDDQEMSYYAAQELSQLIAAAYRVGGPSFSAVSHKSRTNGKARAIKGSGK